MLIAAFLSLNHLPAPNFLELESLGVTQGSPGLAQSTLCPLPAHPTHARRLPKTQCPFNPAVTGVSERSLCLVCPSPALPVQTPSVLPSERPSRLHPHRGHDRVLTCGRVYLTPVGCGGSLWAGTATYSFSSPFSTPNRGSSTERALNTRVHGIQGDSGSRVTESRVELILRDFPASLPTS